MAGDRRAIAPIALAIVLVLAGAIFALARETGAAAEPPVRDARDGCARFYTLSAKSIREQPLETVRVTSAHHRLRDAALRGGDFELVTELNEIIAADSPVKFAERTGSVIGRCVTDRHLTYDQGTEFADELFRRASNHG